MYNMFVCSFVSNDSEKEYAFDTNYSNPAIKDLKYLNCLHELCVTAAECVGEQVKLQ